MTVVNEKDRELIILINNSSPTEEREKIMKALLAAVRWYSSCEAGAKYNVNGVDDENLYTLIQLHEAILKT